VQLFVSRVRGVLGPDLVGVYLTGSGVVGRPGPAVGGILGLVDPAVRGDPVAGRACVEAFPTVARHAEALLAWSNRSARAMLDP